METILSKKMTVSELKYHVENGKTDRFFFTRDTMKFFGDTISNYYISAKEVQIKTHSGELHQCYELRRKRPVKHGLQNSAYFDTKTFARILGKNE